MFESFLKLLRLSLCAVILLGCATSTEDFMARQPDFIYVSRKSPREVSHCIHLNWIKLPGPVVLTKETKEGHRITVHWTELTNMVDIVFEGAGSTIRYYATSMFGESTWRNHVKACGE